MVYYKESLSRIREHFHFSKQELSGLIVAIFVTGFIFSFRDWGAETFDLAQGLTNLVLCLVLVGITFFFRLSFQKFYGVIEGHRAEFKIWWLGIVLSLVFAFVSFGRFSLVLAGGVVTTLMIKYRLGEYRYGFSYWKGAIVAFWGILGNLILAVLFAFGSYLFPGNYFLTKGIVLNLVMAFCSLLPLPQLDGLNIFFGSRILYAIAVIVAIITALLLWWGSILALVVWAIFGIIIGLIVLFIGSEK